MAKWIGLLGLISTFLLGCNGSKDKPPVADQSKASDISGSWFSIDRQGLYNGLGWLEISKEKDDSFSIIIHGDYLFPDSKLVKGSVKETQDKGIFAGKVTGEYSDGKKLSNAVRLSIVSFSTIKNVNGSITLTDPETPEGVELGSFQKKSMDD